MSGRRRLRGRYRPNRKGTKRLDPAALRELVSDNRVWCKVARVVADENGGPHYSREYNAAGQLVDVLVEFETVPDEQLCYGRLSTLGGSPVRGIFVLPAIGDEYLLHFMDGQVGEAIGGLALSAGSMPASAAQATTTNLVICAQQVVITDPLGGGELEAARRTDTVQVTIPTGAVIVAVSGGTVNPAPITLTGQITTGSLVLKIK
jgi:hypothetical protein